MITNEKSERIDILNSIVDEFADLMYVDCMTKIGNIQNTIGIVSNIKWGKDKDYELYSSML